jgi:hypothetical protein
MCDKICTNEDWEKLVIIGSYYHNQKITCPHNICSKKIVELFCDILKITISSSGITRAIFWLLGSTILLV